MPAADPRKRFAEIINQVACGQSSVILTRRGEEIAALVSMEELELLRQIEDVMDIADAKKALAEPDHPHHVSQGQKKGFPVACFRCRVQIGRRFNRVFDASSGLLVIGRLRG